MFHQVLSIVSSAQLNKIYQKHSNFDLRRLLAGTENFFDFLSSECSSNPSILLNAVECLPMPAELRAQIGKIINSIESQSLVFGFLFGKGKLITLRRPQKYSIHASDTLVISNMILSSNSFQSGESWTPICLPKFNDQAFHYAYLTYLRPEVCLVLVSQSKDSFFEMSAIKTQIAKEMDPVILNHLEKFVFKAKYSVGTLIIVNVVDLNVSDVKHFIYKSRTSAQCTWPNFPFANPRNPNEKKETKRYSFS